MSIYKKILLTLIVCLGWAINTQAQLHAKIEVNSQGAGLGVVWRTDTQYSGGFSVVKFDQDFTGVGLGLESPLYHTVHNTADNRPIWAPRVSIEHHKNFLPVSIAGRANLMYYTNLIEGVFAFRPELGITLKTNFYLFYGYHIALGTPDLIPRLHQLTLGVTLPAVD
jgi:hypothetical protein